MQGSLSADIRYSFTVQFLVGATMLAREAGRIESEKGKDASELEQMCHRAHVVGSIMEATAALESEIWEVMVHGPGHHGGSTKIDHAGARLLSPLADTVDRESALTRYALVLHLLQKAPLNPGHQPWQDADLVVRLRNFIVHYKSAWSSKLNDQKLITILRRKHGPPPFEVGKVFPRDILTAACGLWAVESCAAFLDGFYRNLGFPERLDAYRKRI
jgi:hypothetical protein